MQDTTFLDDARKMGQRLRLNRAQLGSIFTSSQLLHYALDLAALALHEELYSHPDTAHHRAALRVQSFSQGYFSLSPLSPTSIPALSDSKKPLHTHHRHTRRRKHTRSTSTYTSPHE